MTRRARHGVVSVMRRRTICLLAAALLGGSFGCGEPSAPRHGPPGLHLRTVSLPSASGPRSRLDVDVFDSTGRAAAFTIVWFKSLEVSPLTSEWAKVAKDTMPYKVLNQWYAPWVLQFDDSTDANGYARAWVSHGQKPGVVGLVEVTVPALGLVDTASFPVLAPTANVKLWKPLGRGCILSGHGKDDQDLSRCGDARPERPYRAA